MKKFEIGKSYVTRSICDYNCKFVITITGRTAKTVSYNYMGEARRSKIRIDDDGCEFIQPDRYSMAPTFRAEREVQPEEAPAADVEETPAPAAAPAPVEAPAASNVVTIAQPVDDGTVILMIGQRVERNCGACFPVVGGTIAGFVDVPDGRFFRGGSFALVRWDDNPDVPERLRLCEIHRRGWRSPGGSPLGVFVR